LPYSFTQLQTTRNCSDSIIDVQPTAATLSRLIMVQSIAHGTWRWNLCHRTVEVNEIIIDDVTASEV